MSIISNEHQHGSPFDREKGEEPPHVVSSTRADAEPDPLPPGMRWCCNKNHGSRYIRRENRFATAADAWTAYEAEVSDLRAEVERVTRERDEAIEERGRMKSGRERKKRRWRKICERHAVALAKSEAAHETTRVGAFELAQEMAKQREAFMPCRCCGWGDPSKDPPSGDEPPIVKGALDEQARCERKTAEARRERDAARAETASLGETARRLADDAAQMIRLLRDLRGYVADSADAEREAEPDMDDEEYAAPDFLRRIDGAIGPPCGACRGDGDDGDATCQACGGTGLARTVAKEQR